MRISDWSSDVCSSDLPWSRVASLGPTPLSNCRLSALPVAGAGAGGGAAGSATGSGVAAGGEVSATGAGAGAGGGVATFLNAGSAATMSGFAGSSGLAGVARSEEHTSELQSLMRISYAVFCLKKTNNSIPIRHQNLKCSTELMKFGDQA